MNSETCAETQYNQMFRKQRENFKSIKREMSSHEGILTKITRSFPLRSFGGRMQRADIV